MSTPNLTLIELDDVINEINRDRLRLYRTRQAEKRHRESYQNDPETDKALDWLMSEQVWEEVTGDEFAIWDTEIVLPEWDENWGKKI